jgi:nitrite reductase (NO-forming)
MLMVLTVFVACSGSPEATPTPEPLSDEQVTGDYEIVMDDMRFEPALITGQPGETLEIILSNTDNIVHDFTIDDLDGERIHESLQPNAVITMSLVLPDEEGEWTFYCSVPGHQELGMEGVLRVTE